MYSKSTKSHINSHPLINMSNMLICHFSVVSKKGTYQKPGTLVTTQRLQRDNNETKASSLFLKVPRLSLPGKSKLDSTKVQNNSACIVLQ